MADPTPAIQCPSCGSTNVAAVPLSLIEAKYYKCGNCVVTFRAQPQEKDRPDIERFNQGWFVPPDDKKP
jgi:DNA-directed RNA polymerase subunit RPC12/RpoP